VDLTTTALELARTYGYLFVFAFVFLETSLLFPLLPSEVVLPASAAIVVTSLASLALFVLVATAGAVVGSVVCYELFRRAGEEAIDGRWLRVERDDAERARRWFRRWGSHSVLWGRLLPVLRSLVSVPAGLSAMNRASFVAYTAVGALAFNAAVGGLVYAGVQASVYRAALAVVRERPLLVVALLVMAVLVVAVVYRRSTVEWRERWS
jgi:membrane protein DedA with SNARE-associated domain